MSDKEMVRKAGATGKIFLSLLIIFPFLCAAAHAQTEGGTDAWKATRYDITVKIDPDRQKLNERARIDIESSADTYALKFMLNEDIHVMDMRATQGTVDYQKNGNVLTVNVDPPIRGKNTLSMELEGQIKMKRGADRPAFMKDSIMLSWEDFWYPFAENGWARSLIKITIPAGFRTVAPGRMTGGRLEGNSVVEIWQNDTPSSFYSLMADTRWIVKNSEKGALRIQTCLYPGEDAEFAERIASTSTDVLNHYSEIFCAYPFSQIAYVELEGLKEPVTCNGFVAYSPDDLIKTYTTDGFDAFSPAFLWWGYIVGGNGGGGWKWIRGLGSYAEYLFCERMHLPQTDRSEETRLQYFLLDSRLERPFTELGPEAPASLIFGKGAGIMEMLRYTIGDERFFRAMKLLFKERYFSRISIDELRGMLEKGSDTKLDGFFREWFERSGAPEFKMKYGIRETYKKEYRVDVKIVQQAGKYSLPVELLIAGKNASRVEKIAVDQEVNDFVFTYDFKPETVTFDPSNKLFKKTSDLKERAVQLSQKMDLEKAILESLKSERQGKFDDAARIYEEALQSEGASRELLYNYARMEQKRKNYQKALDLYTRSERGKAILEKEKDPLPPWICIRRGNIYDLLGMREKALKEYKKALAYPDILESRKVADKYLKEAYTEK